jgi:hypothetical protein
MLEANIQRSTPNAQRSTPNNEEARWIGRSEGDVKIGRVTDFSP